MRIHEGYVAEDVATQEKPVTKILEESASHVVEKGTIVPDEEEEESSDSSSRHASDNDADPEETVQKIL